MSSSPAYQCPCAIRFNWQRDVEPPPPLAFDQPMQRKSPSRGMLRATTLPAATQGTTVAVTRVTKSTSPVSPTSLASLLPLMPASSLSKEELPQRNRLRAEVYAVNAYLREIENDNFKAYMASSRHCIASSVRTDDASDCSDESTVYPIYHQNDLLLRRSPRFSEKRLPLTLKIRNRVEVKTRPKFGGV